jgi:hypothetical protein
MDSESGYVLTLVSKSYNVHVFLLLLSCDDKSSLYVIVMSVKVNKLCFRERAAIVTQVEQSICIPLGKSGRVLQPGCVG